MPDPNTNHIDGFDPLSAEYSSDGSSTSSIFEAASKRVVQNILKSYTGFFDIFSETIQNALDAVQSRQRRELGEYRPQIWITVDIPARRVRVVDNGIGMDEAQFKYCLRPSVSFKKQADLRGHKGVGATFLAYGFSFLKLQSKKDGTTIGAILRQGRQWTEDSSGTVPRPKLEAVPFSVAELANESSGTCFELIVGQAPGERPKELGWIGAQTAEQWYEVLRIKTPLGGVYLSSNNKFFPKINVHVRSTEKVETSYTADRAEYYYPHEIALFKTQALRDISKALHSIQGDASTKFASLSNDFKRLDCVWDVWAKDEILEDNSYFGAALNDDEKQLVERHSVVVYGCFLHSSKRWREFNDEVLSLRKGQRIIHGGLQLASDFMVQGDLNVIPLTSAIGYQASAHVVVHFTDGNPDMGRKVFQPELTELAEKLAIRTVGTFKKFLDFLKADTGAQIMTPDKELHQWKRAQEDFRDKNPLSLAPSGRSLALVSAPRQEQDVIGLFHELIGARVLRGFRFFGTSQNDRYDSLFFMEYEAADLVLFDAKNNKIGINRDYDLPYSTEPKVLEYKFAFDSLVADFEKEEKFSKQIDLVVCWELGDHFKERFYLQSLLVGDEGGARQFFGATHQAYTVGSHSQPNFEILVLEDLLNWLQDPAKEEVRQKLKYRDT